jgi:hexulose-6-phosphate isomerase
MQGRLSPPANGRIQSFPVDTWRDEFRLAREAGLACIEWIYEAGTDAQNPLKTDEGITEIADLARQNGVLVRSICADYYMSELLLDDDGEARQDVVDHLRWLISRAERLGARYVVLPFVDSSSLKTENHTAGLLQVLKTVCADAERAGVELHLETDLKPQDLVAILERIDHPHLRANYDIGNSASLGHDPIEELTLLGKWLGSVHVKDRIRGGHTVKLGTGSADFPNCFRLIMGSGFSGPFILQAARETGLSEVELAKRNRRFVEDHLTALTS